ncbi:MAG TPA: glycoside hydrolase family 31 protein, partial [bacterium]|nr:glycoside hydrolase family 31 protein [bacterium]
HGIREPYNFSERALRIYKSYMQLRYKLIPYFEQLHINNVLTGFPLFYPMNFVYFNNENAEKYKEQYFFGEDIIVVPICEQIKENNGTVEKEIWIPSGEWFDILTGEWHKGEKIIKKEVRINETPIFIKKGGIIISKDYEYPIKIGQYKKIDINIYDIENKERVFYFDDGITKHNFAKEKVSKIILKINRQNKDIYIDLKYDEDYTLKYLPEKIKFKLLVNDEINIFYKGEKIKPEIENENLFSEISSLKKKVLSWS